MTNNFFADYYHGWGGHGGREGGKGEWWKGTQACNSVVWCGLCALLQSTFYPQSWGRPRAINQIAEKKRLRADPKLSTEEFPLKNGKVNLASKMSWYYHLSIRKTEKAERKTKYTRVDLHVVAGVSSDVATETKERGGKRNKKNVEQGMSQQRAYRCWR